MYLTLVPVNMPAAKKEHIVILCYNTIHQPLFIQPCALGLCFHWSNDEGKPKQLQQLLALSIHVRGDTVSLALLSSVLLLQALHDTAAAGVARLTSHGVTLAVRAMTQNNATNRHRKNDGHCQQKAAQPASAAAGTQHMCSL